MATPEIRNARDPGHCPDCKSSEYFSHEIRAFRYHITSKSSADQGLYYLVKLNCPNDPDSHLNECGCIWDRSRQCSLRNRGELLHACAHIITAADLYAKKLHRYPRITELPEVAIAFPIMQSEAEYELFDGDEIPQPTVKRRLALEELITY